MVNFLGPSTIVGPRCIPGLDRPAETLGMLSSLHRRIRSGAAEAAPALALAVGLGFLALGPLGAAPAEARIYGICCDEIVVLSEEGYGLDRSWSCGQDLADASAGTQASVCKQLREADSLCSEIGDICDCDRIADEIEGLEGDNRGLRATADGHRGALPGWETQRREAVEGIYGADGSAAAFLRWLGASLPAGEALDRAAGGDWWARGPLEGLEARLQPYAERWIAWATQDATREADLHTVVEAGVRAARDHYQRTGDARGATERYLEVSPPAREILAGVSSVASLTVVHRHANELADHLQEWAEATRGIRGIQAELDSIDDQIVENASRIEEWHGAGCDWGQAAVGPESRRAPRRGVVPAGVVRTGGFERARPGAWRLTAADISRLPAPRAPSSLERPGPELALALRNVVRLRTLAALLEGLDAELADALLPLGPVLTDQLDDLPPAVQEVLVRLAGQRLSDSLPPLLRAHELGLSVAHDMELELSDPAARAAAGSVRTAAMTVEEATDGALQWPESVGLGPVGGEPGESVSWLLSHLADPMASEEERQAAREALVAIAEALGTGIEPTVPEGLPSFGEWAWVPEGGDWSAWLVEGSWRLPSRVGLPPGSYDLLVEGRRVPLRMVTGVSVPDEGTVGVVVGAALRIERGPEIPMPRSLHGWWAAVPAGESREQWSARTRREVALVPPGEYDIYWKDQYGKDALEIARAVRVEPGEVASVPFRTGMRLEPADWVPEFRSLHGWWGVAPAGAPAGEVVFSSRTERVVALPPGRYDVYWVQANAHHDRPLLLAGEVDVSDGLTTVAVTAGVTLAVSEEDEAELERGSWSVTEAGRGPEERIHWASLGEPMVLPSGTYDLYAQRKGEREPALLAPQVRVGDDLVTVAWPSGAVLSGSPAAGPPRSLVWLAMVLVLTGLVVAGILRHRRRRPGAAAADRP